MSDAETTVIPKEAMPALYQHCLTVWEGLKERAEPHPEDPDILIYTGYTTHLFDELGLSSPYYTKIMNMMKAMDCLRQISRGGGTAQSEWALIREPTTELYQEALNKEGEVAGKSSAKTTMLQQQINDLRDRISTIEDLIDEMGQRIDMTRAAADAPDLTS